MNLQKRVYQKNNRKDDQTLILEGKTYNYKYSFLVFFPFMAFFSRLVYRGNNNPLRSTSSQNQEDNQHRWTFYYSKSSGYDFSLSLSLRT